MSVSADRFTSVYRSNEGMAVELFAGRIQHPQGARLHHRLVIGDGRVGVVVLCRSHDGVLLTWSMRMAAGETMIEFPRGLIEPEDLEARDPLIAAGVRELREETGLETASARLLGTVVVDSAVYPLRVGVVLCEATSTRPTGARDGEIDGMRWVEAEELDRMMVDGQVTDALTLTAVALLRAHESSSLVAVKDAKEEER